MAITVSAKLGKSVYYLSDSLTTGNMTIRRVNSDGEKEFHFPKELLVNYFSEISASSAAEEARLSTRKILERKLSIESSNRYMGWRDLLQKPDETISLPWIGGREILSNDRVFTIRGSLPRNIGWHNFQISGNCLKLIPQARDADSVPGSLDHFVTGYVVGDRLVRDDARSAKYEQILDESEVIWLVEDGLDRFTRIRAGRTDKDGPLFYDGMAMPLGPEDDVRAAYLNAKETLDDVPGVSPSLDAAFKMEVWRREDIRKRRAEAEKLRLEEEARIAAEERRQNIIQKLGDGVGRRIIASVDFEAAASAALTIGGAKFLDSRKSNRKDEMVVTFQVDNRRFECICATNTMRIIDAGICLTSHETGERGDTYFTLESLPSVIREAQKLGKLVVFRHVDGEDHDGEDYDDY